MNKVARIAVFGVLAAVVVIAKTAALEAQVREQPVAFDSAGRMLVLTASAADSAGLRTPTWPVSGAFIEARLFKQTEGGYIVAVRRPDETVDRYSISLEQFAAIRSAVSGTVARPTVAATAPPPVAVVTPQPVAARPDIVAPPPSPRPFGWHPGGRSFANGQVLLTAAVYGPALGNAAVSVIDDPLARYAAWFGTIGASLYMAARASNNPNISFAQSIESNHAGLHGAALGAGATYLLLGNEDGADHGSAYSFGVFAGGVGGAVAGYYAGKRMTSAEAAASAFAADVGLLIGAASVASRNRFEDNWDRGAAATLMGGTLAGYVVGPLYPKLAPQDITVGDVVALAAPATTGILAAAAIASAGDNDDFENQANLLAAGMVAGLAAGHVFVARPRDHSVSDAGVLLIASIAGAYGGTVLGAAGQDGESGTRQLTLATLGSAAAIFVLESRMPRARRGEPMRRVGQIQRRSLKATLDPMAGALVAGGAPGQHALLRITF